MISIEICADATELLPLSPLLDDPYLIPLVASVQFKPVPMLTKDAAFVTRSITIDPANADVVDKMALHVKQRGGFNNYPVGHGCRHLPGSVTLKPRKSDRFPRCFVCSDSDCGAFAVLALGRQTVK